MPSKSRNIIIIVIVGLILFLFFRAKENHYLSKPSQSPLIQVSPIHNPNINPQPSYCTYSRDSRDNQGYDRDEIFKKSIKGYREYTYWGSEHPLQEKTRNFDDDEFDRFIKDEIKDKDVFWGAEY